MSGLRLAFQPRFGLGLLASVACGLFLVCPVVVAADKSQKEDTEKKPDHVGQITAVSTDARTITLEIPPQVKGELPTKVEVKFTDKTKFSYFGVDSVGETPTVGYVALVWLVKDSQDTAAAIRLGRKDADGGKGPDLVGQIVAVSKDGKAITLQVDPQEKGDKPTRHKVKITDKTKFSYFGVDETGELPTVGYLALVWLAEGSKDIAIGIRLGLKE